MSSYDKDIGKFIIAGDFGVGEVVELIDMGDKGEFYRVIFKSSQSINFFSVINQSNYRFIESKDELAKAVSIFKAENEHDQYDSVKDKIQILKKELKSVNIHRLAKYLSCLNQEKENLHPGLSKSFKSSLNSFVQEIEFAYGIDNIEAWHLLGMNKNNN